MAGPITSAFAELRAIAAELDPEETRACLQAMADDDGPRCRCGKPSDGWPDGAGGELCQDCWEVHCAQTWWSAHDAHALVPPPRYRAIVYTGTTRPGPHGTETQTAHEQCTFPDAVSADAWLTARTNATGKEGVLLIQREEALRMYRPTPKG